MFARRSFAFAPRLVNRAPWSFSFRNHKVQGNNLRKGDLVRFGNRVLEVEKTGFCKTGARGNAYTQLELRDVETGKKKMERVRTDQNVESCDVHSVEATFAEMNLTGKFNMGKPEGTVTFELDEVMEEDEEDTITIPASKLPWPAMYYASGLDMILGIRSELLM